MEEEGLLLVARALEGRWTWGIFLRPSLGGRGEGGGREGGAGGSGTGGEEEDGGATGGGRSQGGFEHSVEDECVWGSGEAADQPLGDLWDVHGKEGGREGGRVGLGVSVMDVGNGVIEDVGDCVCMESLIGRNQVNHRRGKIQLYLRAHPPIQLCSRAHPLISCFRSRFPFYPQGSGVKPGSKVNTCKTCRGSGVVTQVTRTPLGNFQTQSVCPECGGAGQVVEEYCGTCSGQGRLEKTKQIKVDIPAGVNDGQKLRVKGEGDAGAKGGENGDLYIFIGVEKDPVFRRDGTDIYSDIKVSYIDAILGTKVKVGVIDGEAEIAIKEGTQAGAVLRLKGRGVPKLMSGEGGARGDHYFTVGVEIPTTLSEEERELVEGLRKEKKEKRGGDGGGEGRLLQFHMMRGEEWGGGGSSQAMVEKGRMKKDE